MQQHAAAKRGRDAYRYILLLLGFVLAPMCIHNLLTGQVLLSGVCVFLLGVLVANIWLLSVGRPAFLSPTPTLSLGIALILLSVALGQDYNLYWLYPLLAGLPVMLDARRSLVVGVLAGVLAIPLIFMHFSFSTAIVLSFSLVITWLVSAWLVFAAAQQSRRLRDIAITDPLTGIYNRRYLEDRVHHALQAWQRYRHTSTLLLIDVDFFKRINDRYGHAAGDDAITRLVGVISARIRTVDTLCRYGGEEFAVLLQETDLETAVRIAEELRLLVEGAKILPEGNVTISIGVCEVVVADSLDHWLKLADNALYLAKRNGRNRVEVSSRLTPRQEVAPATVPEWR